MRPIRVLPRLCGGTPLKKLSERQDRILKYIGDFLDEHGYPPTVRDIQYACTISSTSVVDYNLRILEREGHIRRFPDISRGIEVLDGRMLRRNTTRVPLLGEIAAGLPIPVLASEDFNPADPMDVLDITTSMLKGEQNVYALRVRGVSMIDALIDDGDVVLVKPSREAHNGDMVVAWLKKDKEATLKRFFLEGSKVRLQPANSQMAPIFADAADVEVQGKVVAVLRNFA
ncbi:MAG: transcriptional repressor LexA [Chloroflexi bacterium]|nr:transcriptional repressor LexA [Chloroflexota bacterium]